MSNNIESGEYFKIFSDCIVVPGACFSAIYDLGRRSIHRFSSQHLDIVQSFASGRSLSDLNGSAQTVLSYLKDIDAGIVTTEDECKRLPKIAESWASPYEIENAIIDIDKVDHNYNSIISDLSELQCQSIQVRGFSSRLNLNIVAIILDLAATTTIDSVEIILKWTPDFDPLLFAELVRKFPMLADLTVHSAPNDETFDVNVESNGYRRTVTFVSEIIASADACGRITRRTLTAPSAGLFFELKNFNGCLNKKVSIAADGTVRNCPSLSMIHGLAGENSIKDLVRAPLFQSIWGIRKDDITGCRDCEFRYVCTDCRAFLSQDHSYDKPAKCGYDPYRGAWES